MVVTTDNKYQTMPDLTQDEYEALKADIAKRGVMIPIEYDENGYILEGHHRHKACEELGITDYPRIVRTGMTEEEKRAHSRSLNMVRRQLTREQRQYIIREQLKETPHLSDRQIAAMLGVDHKTVATQRQGLLSTGEIPQLTKTLGADGKERPRQTRAAAEQPEVVYVDAEPDTQPVLVADGKKPHVAYNTGMNEWYTPQQYIDAARRVMGGIDLDPASSEVANRTVQAEQFYTEQTNGLDKQWYGRVWLNPPYSSDKIGKFADKLVSEIPNIESALVLVNNATETQWFKAIVSVSSAVCFPNGRVHFLRPDGSTGAPLQGQAVLYAGDDTESFVREFSRFGWVATVA